MPEGDTVWRTARHLDAALAGSTLTRSDFRVPRYATVDLSGQRVDQVASRGKHLLLRTPTVIVHSHLAMEGAWHLYRRPRSRWRRPGHTARAILENEEWQAVGFSLGVVEVLSRAREDEVVGHLGPDLLDPDVDLDLGASNVAAGRDRPIFLALLDQRNIAGFGNEYVNEILFLSDLAPTTPVAEVEDVDAVVRLGHRLITSNVRTIQRDFGAPRAGNWVYGRAGRPCRRCGAIIRRGQLGDDPTRERIVFWCPRCQPDRTAGAAI